MGEGGRADGAAAFAWGRPVLTMTSKAAGERGGRSASLPGGPVTAGDFPGEGVAAAAAAARPAVTVSTPGKLILMGEHAVVYGRPALVAAIDLRLRARFSALPAASRSVVEIDLPGLAHRVTVPWGEVLAYARTARDSWAAYAARPGLAGFLELRGDDPAHIVKAALGEVAAALGEEAGGAPALGLRLDSELPIGAGFGSSAAAAVAVVAGYACWRGHDDLDGATIARLALEAERRQHGLPSGVDTTTSLQGGLLWARRLQASPGGLPGGELACERLAADAPLLGRLRVYHTGTPPEATGAVVAAVRTRRDRDPAATERLFDRMEAATRGLRAELGAAVERPERVTALIREHQACLESLGVVPEPVRALVRRVEAAGGAAKVSGAGSLAGPGAGSLLVYHADPEAVAGWEHLRPFAHLPVHLGAAGFRRETS
jgi:mevalonate kinase